MTWHLCSWSLMLIYYIFDGLIFSVFQVWRWDQQAQWVWEQLCSPQKGLHTSWNYYSHQAHWAHTVTLWPLAEGCAVCNNECWCFPLQDTDAAYLFKVELEAKLDGLSDEIEFLRQLYDTVITFLYFIHFWWITDLTGILKRTIFLCRKFMSCRARSRTRLLL